MPKKSPPNIISRHSRVVKNRYRVGHRLGVAHFLGVVHGLEVVLHLLVPSPTWYCFRSSRPRNLCFAFTPSASRSTAPPRGRPRPRDRLPPFGSKSHLDHISSWNLCFALTPSASRSTAPPRGRPRPRVPRGRPHRLEVVHGLEVGLHPLVPSFTWIIYAHGTCVSPSRLVPRGRPHRLGVVRGLEIVFHLLVPSPTWSCFGSLQPQNLCFAFMPSASRLAAVLRPPTASGSS
nr:hypothetical protein Iba_scaffold1050CG0420 [Ipomoea batatas]